MEIECYGSGRCIREKYHPFHHLLRLMARKCINTSLIVNQGVFGCGFWTMDGCHLVAIDKFSPSG
jgi:hypothetical protein